MNILGLETHEHESKNALSEKISASFTESSTYTSTSSSKQSVIQLTTLWQNVSRDFKPTKLLFCFQDGKVQNIISSSKSVGVRKPPQFPSNISSSQALWKNLSPCWLLLTVNYIYRVSVRKSIFLFIKKSKTSHFLKLKNKLKSLKVLL